jgi:hypothetical protein
MPEFYFHYLKKVLVLYDSSICQNTWGIFGFQYHSSLDGNSEPGSFWTG